ncbi:MAG: right-handed parallel beta-helix repeat-containing protein [Gemmatimonadaceae bacterium]|nr:right-handed parallel beta-helix repeat-containing protein [Gemmatimonadaceae bacterium]
MHLVYASVASLTVLTMVATLPTLRAQPARVDTVTPTAGLVLRRSTVLRPGRWVLPALDDSTPVLRVRGTDLTIDLTGVTLIGSDSTAAPDAARGIALRIEDGARITVRGGRVRGYRIAIDARRVTGLELTGQDLSDNWRPRLWSDRAHESLADWLSFHQNERGEWRRYGAAVYLDSVVGGTIRDLVVTRGMNGVLLHRSHRLLLTRNTIRWNSGVGIALYRSSDNRLLHNRVDFNVRGYSHGIYKRGQDSAALLLYEQSCRNVVAYNSLTHSGDGIFLWAGQSTMDSGFGGANDNLFYGNDASFAPTNGIEATFSRNAFVANRVEGNDHGLWGGYSFDSRVVANAFADNRIAIAIEHGQDNTIGDNRFDGGSTAIHLWWNRREPSDWGYPRYRDTRSRDVVIVRNQFAAHRVALRATDTQGITWQANQARTVDSLLVLAGDTSGMQLDGARAVTARIPSDSTATRGCVVPPFASPAATRDRPRPLADPRWAFCSAPVPRGRQHIRMGAWGPLRPGEADDAPMRVATAPWQVRVVAWDSLSDPRRDTTALFARAALFERDIPALDAVWFRPPPAAPSGGTAPQPSHPLLGVPAQRWALRASSTVQVDAPGAELIAISDDGVRVWVDDRLVIDAWTPHESRVDRVPLAVGAHRLRVEYYQVDGWTELQLRVERAPMPRP